MGSPPDPRPTLRSIARAAGVSLGTVSLALRDSPQTSRETRARIKAIAERLGYRPDPRIARLMSYLQQPKRPKDVGTLAFLTAFAERDIWRESATWTNYFEGAAAQAEALGYRLEHFWVRQPGMTGERVSRILHSRGIEGLLVAPMPRGIRSLELRWELFSTVAFGYSLQEPRVHRAVHHHFHTIMRTTAELRARGYERIGLVIGPEHDDRVANIWSAGFLAFKDVLDPQHAAPLYRGPVEARPLLKWFRQHKPDAIVSDELSAVDLLDRAGYRLPHDYAFVTLDWQKHTENFAGMDQHSRDIGAAAAKHVIAALNRDEHGIPVRPETVMIEGTWVDGASAPAVQGRAAITTPLKAAWLDRSTWQ